MKELFVDIINPKKPLEAEKLFRACWRGKEEITPEIAMEVLRSTNFVTCIKRMLECVEKLPLEKQATFKEVVLSAFAGREQPESVKEVGMRLASALGIEAEYNAAAERIGGKRYIASSPNYEIFDVFNGEAYGHVYREFGGVKRAVFDSPEITFTKVDVFPEYLDLSYCKKVKFADCYSLAKVKDIKFKPGAEVVFNNTRLPQVLDLSPCASVDMNASDVSRVSYLKGGDFTAMSGVKGTPAVIDLSAASSANLNGDIFNQKTEVRYKEGMSVCYVAGENLPDYLDVSTLGRVGFFYCGLGNLKEIKFKDGAFVNFGDMVEELHQDFDLTKCNKIKISSTSYSDMYNRVRVREGAVLELSGVQQEVPEVVDVSGFDKVILAECDFSGAKEIRFKVGAAVETKTCANLPKVLDFSRCRAVKFDGCGADAVKEIRFADKEQAAAVKLAPKLAEKAVFADKPTAAGGNLWSRWFNKGR